MLIMAPQKDYAEGRRSAEMERLWRFSQQNMQEDTDQETIALCHWIVGASKFEGLQFLRQWAEDQEPCVQVMLTLDGVTKEVEFRKIDLRKFVTAVFAGNESFMAFLRAEAQEDLIANIEYAAQGGVGEN